MNVQRCFSKASRRFLSVNLPDFSHAEGMVDVSDKAVSSRTAIASCRIQLPQRICNSIFDPTFALNKKGDIVSTAKLAGIMAAKKTPELIPLCHQIPLSQVTLDITKTSPTEMTIIGSVKAVAQTGVEMEALAAVSIAALTVYDMTKSALKNTADSITITDIRLVSKLKA